MDRHWVLGADAGKQVVRRAPFAHVVFCVDLEEIDTHLAFENVPRVLMLETHASTGRNESVARPPAQNQFIRCTHHDVRNPFCETGARQGLGGPQPASAKARGVNSDSGTQEPLIGCSEPLPSGVLTVLQVPFATYFQELPW
jgi:hypothetical protein